MVIRFRRLEDWRTHAPPKKKDKHWKEGRSAMELGKAWFRSGAVAVREELLTLLCSHDLTRNLIVERGWAERVTELDDFRGEGRNNDMLLLGKSAGQPVVIALEAKADDHLARWSKSTRRGGRRGRTSPSESRVS